LRSEALTLSTSEGCIHLEENEWGCRRRPEPGRRPGEDFGGRGSSVKKASYRVNGFGVLKPTTSRQSREICCSYKVFVFGFNTFMTAAERRGIKPSTRITALPLLNLLTVKIPGALLWEYMVGETGRTSRVYLYVSPVLRYTPVMPLRRLR
jgi:hypothetical protein